MQEEVGKDLTPEYCEQCQTEVQKMAKRELLLYQPYSKVICMIAIHLNPIEETSTIEETSDELKVEYFELKSRLDTALQLQPFLSEANATQIMSILSG